VRLAAAVLLFALCAVAKVHFPQQSLPWRQQLSDLIGSQTDLNQAFSQLGEELERREEVVHALGDFCVSVFAPEGVNIPAEGEGSAPAESSLPEDASQEAAW
jgi:hypothetical protein